MVFRSKNYISPIERIVYSKLMKDLGIEPYYKRGLIRSVVGVGCVIIGLVTFAVPFTTIPLLLFGGSLIGYDIKSLIGRFKYEGHLIKIKMVRLKRW